MPEITKTTLLLPRFQVYKFSRRVDCQKHSFPPCASRGVPLFSPMQAFPLMCLPEKSNIFSLRFARCIVFFSIHESLPPLWVPGTWYVFPCSSARPRISNFPPLDRIGVSAEHNCWLGAASSVFVFFRLSGLKTLLKCFWKYFIKNIEKLTFHGLTFHLIAFHDNGTAYSITFNSIPYHTTA